MCVCVIYIPIARKLNSYFIHFYMAEQLYIYISLTINKITNKNKNEWPINLLYIFLEKFLANLYIVI